MGMEFRPPLLLEGRWVKLVPLAVEQARSLVAAAQDPEIWRYLRTGPRTTAAELEDHVRACLELQRTGSDLGFATWFKPWERYVGMTRFLDIDRPHRHAEIGGTWIDSRLWRTPVNTEAKFLMLRHAIEVEGCVRVQIKTDLRNERSQRAIARLGAQREGLLRRHVILPDGYIRDSVIFSIIDLDWPQVKPRLEAFLARAWDPPPPPPPGA